MDYLIDVNIIRAYGLAGRNIDLEFAEVSLYRCTLGQCTCGTVCREVVLSGSDDIVAWRGYFRIVAAWFDCGNDFREIAAVNDIISHIGECGEDNAQECYDQQSVLHSSKIFAKITNSVQIQRGDRLMGFLIPIG